MDIENMSKLDIDQDKVKLISDRCQELTNIKQKQKEIEDQLSEVKNKGRDLEERVIPEMMAEAGVSKLKMKDGTEVEVKPFYAAKIPESRTEEAFSYLRNNGFEDLIKNTVTASFSRGQDNQVSELIRVCEEHKFSYVKKEKVERLWPLYGDTQYEDDNIMKLEHLGTRPCSDQNGIIPAIDFTLKIGNKNKSQRLKALQMKWAGELKNHKNIIINTPLGEGQSFGIANVGVKGLSPSELADKLFDDFNIFTVPIDDDRGIHGIRVSPNLYSTMEDIEKFLDAMIKIAV